MDAWAAPIDPSWPVRVTLPVGSSAQTPSHQSTPTREARLQPPEGNAVSVIVISPDRYTRAPLAEAPRNATAATTGDATSLATEKRKRSITPWVGAGSAMDMKLRRSVNSSISSPSLIQLL